MLLTARGSQIFARGSQIFLSASKPPQHGFREPVAASPGERKRIHHYWADLLLDIVAQHGAGAK
jgi:hypothetical protein